MIPPVGMAALAIVFYGACWGLLSLWQLAPAGDHGAALGLFSLGIGTAALLALAIAQWARPGSGRHWTRACVVLVLWTGLSWAMPDVEALRAPLLLALAGAVAWVALVSWRHGDGRAAAAWAIVAGTEAVAVVSRYGCKFELVEALAGPWAGETVCGAVLGPNAADVMSSAVVLGGLGMMAWLTVYRPSS